MPAHDPDARLLLETLVGFDTVSAKPNLALITFIKDYLARYGVGRPTVIAGDHHHLYPKPG